MTITKEQIITQVNELKKLMDGCDTLEEARRRSKKFQLTLECGGAHLDGDSIWYDRDITDNEIEWFRVEAYKNLGYIYFFKDGMIMFDVWDIDDNEGDPIMEDVTLETLDEHIKLGY